MRKRCISVMLCMLLAFQAFSAQYSYADLYSMMLANNTELGKSAEDIYKAQLMTKNVKALYQPTIGYSIYGAYAANPPIGQIVVGTDDIMNQLGYSMNSAGNSFVTLYDGMENTYYGASLSLTQVITTSGKIPIAENIANLSTEMQSIRNTDLLNQLVAELNTRLYAHSYMMQISALLDSVQNDADELLSIAGKANSTGMLTNQELSDSRIQAEEVKVRKKEVESNISSNLQAIRTLTGIADLEAEDIIFTPDESIFRKYEGCSLQAIMDAAAAPSNDNLRLLDKAEAIAKKQEDLAWRNIYGAPEAYLSVSAGYGGPRFPFAEIGWRQEDDWSVNVAVTIRGNLWDGGKRLNSIDSAKSNQRTAELSYKEAEDTLRSAAEENYSAASLSLAKIDYMTLKKENNDSKIAEIRKEAEAGRKSRKDILSQNIDNLQNEIELIQQKISLSGNIFMLDYLTGN